MDSKDGTDIKLTSQEAHMFQKAFEKEEFRKLFAEYMEEISDPDNRAKYEEEMTSLERERGFDITFLKPEAGYVIKLMGNGKKTFINICKNENVDAPFKKVPGRDEKTAYSWNIPMMFSKPRDELDKKGSSCMVYDVMFNPNAFSFAEKLKGFRSIMEDSALTHVEKNFNVVLDTKCLKYPKMKYKGTPSRCVIRKKSKHNGPEEIMDDEWKGLLPKPYNELGDITEATFNTTMSVKPQNIANLPEVPKYSYKYREYDDMSNHLSGCGTKKVEIIIDIEVPLVSSAAELEVDTSEKHVIIKSVSGKHNYTAKINFPYLVRDVDGRAEFDLRSKKLILTFPVVQPKRCGNDKLNLKTSIQNSKTCEANSQSDSVAGKESVVHSLNSSNDNATSENPKSANSRHEEILENKSDLNGAFVNEDESLNSNSGAMEVIHDLNQDDTLAESIDFSTAEFQNREKIIDIQSGLPIKKNVKCIERSSECTSDEVCDFCVQHTLNVCTDDIVDYEGYESCNKMMFRFSVRCVRSDSVAIFYCKCSSAVQIHYESLGSGYVYRLSFGTSKKILHNKITVLITKENISIRIEKHKDNNFYWKKFWFANHSNILEEKSFIITSFCKNSFRLDEKSNILSCVESLHSEHKNCTDNFCLIGDNSSSTSIKGSGMHEEFFGLSGNVPEDFNQNHLEPSSNHDFAIQQSSDSNGYSETQPNSAVPGTKSESSVISSETESALKTLTSSTDDKLLFTSTNSDFQTQAATQETKVCNAFENDIVLRGNDSIPENFDRVKSTVETETQSVINCAKCIIDETKGNEYEEDEKHRYSELKGKNILQMLAIDKKVLCDRQEGHALKSNEQVLSKPVNITDERITESDDGAEINKPTFENMHAEFYSVVSVDKESSIVSYDSPALSVASLPCHSQSSTDRCIVDNLGSLNVPNSLNVPPSCSENHSNFSIALDELNILKEVDSTSCESKAHVLKEISESVCENGTKLQSLKNSDEHFNNKESHDNRQFLASEKPESISGPEVTLTEKNSKTNIMKFKNTVMFELD